MDIQLNIFQPVNSGISFESWVHLTSEKKKVEAEVEVWPIKRSQNGCKSHRKRQGKID